MKKNRGSDMRPPEDEGLQNGSISAEEYAHLKDAADKALEKYPETTALILPGGGADLLIERLTCRKCGSVVCPEHNGNLRPVAGDTMISVPLDERRWTPPFPQRIADRIADRLKVVV